MSENYKEKIKIMWPCPSNPPVLSLASGDTVFGEDFAESMRCFFCSASDVGAWLSLFGRFRRLYGTNSRTGPVYNESRFFFLNPFEIPKINIITNSNNLRIIIGNKDSFSTVDSYHGLVVTTGSTCARCGMGHQYTIVYQTL